MKKYFLAHLKGIMAVAMLLMTNQAWAADIMINNQSIGSTPVSMGGGTAVYADGVLTLNNINLPAAETYHSDGNPGYECAIYSNLEELTIELIGKNVFTINERTGYYYKCGLYMSDKNSDLIIQSSSRSGSLALNTGSNPDIGGYGIISKGNIIIKSGTITTSCGEGQQTYGIYASKLTLNGGKVDFSGGYGGFLSYGIYASKLVINGGRGSCYGGSRCAYKDGLLSGALSGQIDRESKNSSWATPLVKRISTLDCTAFTQDQFSDKEYWIWDHTNKTLILDGCDIEIPDTTDDSYGIKLPNGATLLLNDDTESKVLTHDTNGSNYAIHSAGTITVDGSINGKMNVTAGESPSASYGIYGNVINIKGGTATVGSAATSGTHQAFNKQPIFDKVILPSSTASWNSPLYDWSVRTFSLGDQSGSIKSIIGGTAKFAIQGTPSRGPITYEWFSDDSGKTPISKPAGITISPSSIGETDTDITVTGDTTVEIAEYYFRATMGGLTTNLKKLTIVDGAIYYNIWINDRQFSSTNTSFKIGGGTAAYDDQSKTLTLTNMNMSSPIVHMVGSVESGIFLSDNFTIKLVGNNIITMPSAQDNYSVGIYSRASITFTAEEGGTLTVFSGSSGANSVGINVDNFIIDSGTIIAGGLASKAGNSTGIHADKTFTMNAGTIVASGTDGFNGSYGVTADKSITINGGNGKLNGSPKSFDRQPGGTIGSTISSWESPLCTWGTMPVLTVTFDSNEGSAVSPVTNVDIATTITQPAQPTKAGYDFEGWFTDNTTFGCAWDFTKNIVAGNMTLYAKWEVSTNIDRTQANTNIVLAGGKGNLTITTETAQTVQVIAVDGRVVRTISLNAGETETIIGLSAGIYIAGGQKAVVK